MDLPTRADLFNIGADVVISRSQARPPGRRVNPEEVFTDGSDVNLLLAAASAMGDEAVRHLATRLSAHFLSGAELTDLDRLILDRFTNELPRQEATAAVADLELRQVPGGPAQSFAVGTVARSASGVEFETVFAATIAAASVGPVTVRARCRVTGPQGNVDPGTITALRNPVAGVSVTNLERAAGGDDSESDSRYRARAQRFFASARRGILAAIEMGALSVSGVRAAVAEELLDEDGFPNGWVRLFFADASGAGNAALAAQIRDRLRAWRASGIVVDVVAAVPRYEPISLRLRFATGVDSTLAFDTVRRRVLSAVNSLDPQATLQRSLIITSARAVAGVLVLDDAVVVPVGDIVPGQGEIIRTRLDLVTPAT